MKVSNFILFIGDSQKIIIDFIMKNVRRGSYFKYLQKKSSKVPRQTMWNIRNREKRVKKFVREEQIMCDTNAIDDENMSIVVENDSQDENNTSNVLVNTNLSETDGMNLPNNTNISIVDESSESYSILGDLSNSVNETQIPTNYIEDEYELRIDCFQTIHENLECTKFDALCMIYAYSVRHNLNWTATEDLTRLINAIIGTESLVPSKYMYKQVFESKLVRPTVHFFCQMCNKYFGVKNQSEHLLCHSCHSEICTDTKYKKNHFISIPIESHLKNILEQNAGNLLFDTRTSADDIYDVHDAQNFKRLKNEKENEPYITLTMYTDGAAVFNSTKQKSLWPICVYINEIKLEHRFKRHNILCSALSFGKTPNVQYFFKPMIEEIKMINENGGIRFHDKSGQSMGVKVIPMIFSADAPAKADVLI